MPIRPSSQAQRDAVRRHDTEKVERITIRLPKGTREVIKPTGLSVNAFVVDAVTEKIARDSGGASMVILSAEDAERYTKEAKDRDMTLQELFLEAVNVFLKEY